MNVSLPTKGSFIVAAMTPPISRSPFNRGTVIVQSPDGILVRLGEAAWEGHVSGRPMTEEDLRVLVFEEQVTPLPERVPVVSGAEAWVLRPKFPAKEREVDALRRTGALLCPPLPGDDGASICVVDTDRPELASVLDRWRDDAARWFHEEASGGRWEYALQEAEVAFALEGTLASSTLARLALALSRCGREMRAAGLLVMARRSRGAAFEASVVEELGRLRALFGSQ